MNRAVILPDLTIEDILGLLESVVCGSLRSSFDLVESRGEVGRRFSLGTNGVKIGRRGVLALRKGDKLVAGAFDDGERDEVSGH